MWEGGTGIIGCVCIGKEAKTCDMLPATGSMSQVINARPGAGRDHCYQEGCGLIAPERSRGRAATVTG